MATYYATYTGKVQIPSDYGKMVVPVFTVDVPFAKGNTYVLIAANAYVSGLEGVSTIAVINGERYVVPTPTATTNVTDYTIGNIMPDTDSYPIITADENRGSLKAYIGDRTASSDRIEWNAQFGIGTSGSLEGSTVYYGFSTGTSGNQQDRYASPHLANQVAIIAMLKDSNGLAGIGLMYFYQTHGTYDSGITIEHERYPSLGNLGKLKGIHGITSYNHSFTLSTGSSVSIPSTYTEVANYLMIEPYSEDGDDPYSDFPSNIEDPGDPDPDQEDDDILPAPLPSLSFADTGFTRIFAPNITELNALANYMWTDQTFLQTLLNHAKQILENPIDAIITLNLVPCVPSVGASKEVKIMYIGTGVYMSPVVSQFVRVDCGTYTIKRMYGSALDYNPYTRVQLYLPYIGTVQLDTDEVMGKTLHVYYNIDVVTGLCCAVVQCNNDVLYQFSGHCAVQQPITSADFSEYISAAIAAGKMVASIAAFGAGAPVVGQTLAGAPVASSRSGSGERIVRSRNPDTNRLRQQAVILDSFSRSSPGASFGEVAARGVSNTVGAVMNSKVAFQHSGGFGGNSGYIAGVRRPYLIITRPRIANPTNYGKYNGRPAMLYRSLSECSGFTQVQSIQLTGIRATNPELSEIASLLTSGVIL